MNVFPESDCFSPSPPLLSWSEPLLSLSWISVINLPSWSLFFYSWPLDSLFSIQQLGRPVKTQAGHIGSSAQSPAWLQFSLRIKAKEREGTIWLFIICLPITPLTSDFISHFSLHAHSTPVTLAPCCTLNMTCMLFFWAFSLARLSAWKRSCSKYRR